VSEKATFVACLTPPGTGAIATLALRGPHAWAVVRELFQPRSTRHSLPAEPEAGPVWLGRLGGEVADEVVLTVKGTTPVPWVELHGHGGREAIRLLVEAFTSRGVQACSWQDLERRTADDLLRTEAAAALVEARTTRTAAILLDQYQGAFGRAVDDVSAALQRGDAAEALRLLADLTRYSGLGRRLTTPWRVALAGAPNVGKSSLVNALAGYQRSVVAATPGTTRDVVTTLLAIDGWPVELADTAGLRAPAGPLEGEGISRARAAAVEADVCLWVLDAAAPPVWPFSSDNVRLVVNKIDLPSAWDQGQVAGAVHVSARTGAGLEDLCRALAGWLVPAPPPAGAAVPFTPLLADRLEAVRHACSAGRLLEAAQLLATLKRRMEPEFV
jgi:tRNA modification GTPase